MKKWELQFEVCAKIQKVHFIKENYGIDFSLALMKKFFLRGRGDD